MAARAQLDKERKVSSAVRVVDRVVYVWARATPVLKLSQPH